MSFMTRATKDCILLTVRSDPCDASATKPNKPGGGVTQKRVHRFASRIPARKSSSSQFQVNDSTKQNHENKIRVHHHSHSVLAVGSICANTACSSTAATTAASAASAGNAG